MCQNQEGEWWGMAFPEAPAEDRRRESWGLEADYELALQENLCQGHHLMHLRIKLAGRDGFYLTSSILVPLWWCGASTLPPGSCPPPPPPWLVARM